MQESKRAWVIPSQVQSLYTCWWENGQVTQPYPSLAAIRDNVQDSLKTLRQDHKRSLNPTPYKVRHMCKICFVSPAFSSFFFLKKWARSICYALLLNTFQVQFHSKLLSLLFLYSKHNLRPKVGLSANLYKKSKPFMPSKPGSNSTKCSSTASSSSLFHHLFYNNPRSKAGELFTYSIVCKHSHSVKWKQLRINSM